MKHIRGALAPLLVWTLGSACAGPFAMETPPEMVALEEPEWSQYDYRATTPSGVVVAARVIRHGAGQETPSGDLAFWTDAIKLRMRTTAGYALLAEEPFVSRDGTTGVRLRFGRDQQQTPYGYHVVLLVTDRFVHVVEAGGRADLLEASGDVVEEAFASYSVLR